MRQLDKTEKELTEKGIKRLSREIEELKELEKVQKARKEYQIAKKKFEAIAKPYNDKIEENEIKKLLEGVELEIKAKQSSINEMERQIKYGVQEKENKSVG